MGKPTERREGLEQVFDELSKKYRVRIPQSARKCVLDYLEDAIARGDEIDYPPGKTKPVRLGDCVADGIEKGHINIYLREILKYSHRMLRRPE